ncbi:MAG: ParB N-terminal domain-containing protein [Nitrosopumilaceae archaeon]|nr:ParB N-terminal domain-containing protein [Nitrosopumilaceae archaeon]
MKWKIEERKLSELVGMATNPRQISKHDFLHLTESIEKFGQCQPIVINHDNTIIGGHQRACAMKKLGFSNVEVAVPDLPLSEKEISELNIRLNRNNGEWDFDILANAWELGDLLEWGFVKDEFHLESVENITDQIEEDEKEKPAKKCTMTIIFSDEKQLQDAENRIATILDEYQGTVYKVKI